jgi:hypothetical protein
MLRIYYKHRADIHDLALIYASLMFVASLLP